MSLGSSACRQCLSSDILRNNFLSPADMSSSILKVWQQNPRLKAFRNKLSRRALSPANMEEHRWQQTIQRQYPVNIICKVLRDNPRLFSCASKYIHWLATDRMCSTCVTAEKITVTNSKNFSNFNLFNKRQRLWWGEITSRWTSKYKFFIFGNTNLKLVSNQVASWSIQPFGQNRHGPKIGWGCAVFAGGAESPSNKVAWAKAYLHAKFHFDPSNYLATIYQCHRQTDQDNGPIANRFTNGRPKTNSQL